MAYSLIDGHYKFESAVQIMINKSDKDPKKLEALRARLQAGEESPLIEDFDPEELLRLLNGCSPESFKLTEEDKEWMHAPPVGKELI
ncbi:MAG: hypothetical protein JAZ15_21210 [Candidatus Thiodiazotropha endolucinida]|nr:hypothetical protein [Candidatus Thiodiazotropha taylori]MCW4345449.1 hypothetical protein [Candidatus Thiodiazotropha endolucinida]MCG8047708.1 hypothetical protein [Candidatus Thiodiazotropha taylori]MCG8053718.1 hypothetical protein [Candidatus Thiodiazotropha taylori]MCW4315538.1 hypothetical protein [Candidatus Thiodiazotropha taylori]